MGLHHVELWVADLTGARARWGWLLGALGWRPFQDWSEGFSMREGSGADSVYLVIEQSPALRAGAAHDRMAPGLNHLALNAESRALVDRLAAEAPAHGWRLMFADQHPHAGGPEHYAAYLESTDGFEVEVVAPPPSRDTTTS
jgi:catechol 2,3-dioxygenase-like lactoylglutathione lyase family enzyme